MSLIFKDQTALKLILKTNIDFNTYAVNIAKIKYIDPKKTEEEFNASVLIGSESEGKIYVDFSSSIKFAIAGKYILWADIIFTDTRQAQGQSVALIVYQSGKDH